MMMLTCFEPKKRCKNTLLSALLIFTAAASLSFVAQESPKEKWDIPEEYKTMKNPLKKSTENLAQGKKLYTKHCAGCHGNNGDGDGEKVKQLIENSLRPANFKIAEFKSEPDGVHFYKIKIGREGMHSYKGKIADENIWEIILHISTFQ